MSVKKVLYRRSHAPSAAPLVSQPVIYTYLSPISSHLYSMCSIAENVCMYNYVMRKVRISTILEFCCTNLGSELCAIILGSCTQTSDPRICCANLGSVCNNLGLRNQTSAICGNKHTINCTSKAAQPSMTTKPRSIAQASSSAIRRMIMGSLPAELECVHYLSIVGSLPRMAELLGVCNQSLLLLLLILLLLVNFTRQSMRKWMIKNKIQNGVRLF